MGGYDDARGEVWVLEEAEVVAGENRGGVNVGEELWVVLLGRGPFL